MKSSQEPFLFGNIITSIEGEVFKKNFKINDKIQFEIQKNGKKQRVQIPFKRYYEEVPKNSLLCLIGSSGFLEISSNQNDASKILNVSGNELIKINNI